jgi:NAD(P)-dependent dehydrogenase (short-subunit alcohol dehydrogenase family)
MSKRGRNGLTAAPRSLAVTGASTGIGHAVAKLATAQGWRVFGGVRNEADAERLTEEFGASFTPLLFDVRDEAAVAAAAKAVHASLGSGTLNGLVNNAGIGLPGPVRHQPIDEFRTVLDTNVLGTLVASRAFAPLLGADQTLSGAKSSPSSLLPRLPERSDNHSQARTSPRNSRSKACPRCHGANSISTESAW